MKRHAADGVKEIRQAIEATTYGSVDTYLTDQVGVDAHTTERLRARLLDGRPARAS